MTLPQASSRLHLVKPRVAADEGAVAQNGAVVPRLERIASHFGGLSETLDTGDMFAASWNLQLVAQDIRAIGSGLAGESRCLQDLIGLNHVLSRRIADIDDDVRLLSAMVSNAKVELASIDAHGESLDGFGETLEMITAKAKHTLRDYQATHERLSTELRRTAALHDAFELGHQRKLQAISQEIDESVTTFRGRHKIIAAAAGDIAATAKAIASQITEESGPQTKVAQLSQLAHRTADLASPGNPLIATRGELVTSFSRDLEPKLKTAEALIRQCRDSRAAVDGTASFVVATFDTLTALAEQVGAMVIDMTIIGTNAIVKSYRLGQRGAGLSIIAQHLRSHALKIADGITRLTPAMAEARDAARSFTMALNTQDAAHMAALAERTAEVIASFATVGAQTAQLIAFLESESACIADTLRRSVEKQEATELPH